MLGQRTVLVVGAGASSEYGLPLGSDLKTHIQDYLQFDIENGFIRGGDEHIRYILDSYSARAPEWLEAAKLIRRKLIQARSIDELVDFHSDNPNLNLLSKVAIARCISDAEQNSRLGGEHDVFDKLQRCSGTYLDFLFKILAENVPRNQPEKLFDNLTIICFNYDRIIEAYFGLAIHNWFDLSGSETQEILNTLKIIHPYGSLGHLPIITKKNNYFDNKDQFRHTNFLDMAKGLRTYSEQLSDSYLAIDLKNEISRAEHIIFLGFAFHEPNMSIITPDNAPLPETTAVSGTMIVPTEDDELIAKARIRKIVRVNQGTTTLDLAHRIVDGGPPYLSKCNCCEYFRTRGSRLLAKS